MVECLGFKFINVDKWNVKEYHKPLQFDLFLKLFIAPKKGFKASISLFQCSTNENINSRTIIGIFQTNYFHHLYFLLSRVHQHTGASLLENF
jgi:hypothetical protein